MGEIVKAIEKMVDDGFAYEVKGNVYFRVTAVPNYGQLSHIEHAKLIAGARVAENEEKENSNDFVLWKKTSEGITWPSRWGQGRPGWHTECVVMIKSILGKEIDIHGGAFDLKFPHHENELAQSYALDDHLLAHSFVYVGFVNNDKEKMSKSLHNVRYSSQVLDEYGEQATVFFLLSASYSAPLSYSEEAMRQAVHEVDKYRQGLKLADLYVLKKAISYVLLPDQRDEILKKFFLALADDFNLANAFSELSQLLKELNIALKNSDGQTIFLLREAIRYGLDILEIHFSPLVLSPDDLHLVKRLDQLRQLKQYEESDRIRDQLVKKGIL
jgi:cysteinyl-tRNA synthetase